MNNPVNTPGQRSGKTRTGAQDQQSQPSQADRAKAVDPPSGEVRAALEVVKVLTFGLVEPLSHQSDSRSSTADNPATDQASTQWLGAKVAGLASAVAFRPRGRLGGDYFSATEIRPGVGRYIIADVAGHDMAASVVVAVMRIARIAMRNGVTTTSEQIIALLNNLLLGELSRLGTFITAAIVEVDGATGQVTSYNCGHPAPRVRMPNGVVRQLAQESTMPIGVAPNIHARAVHDHIDHGESIILFTDGVVESRNQQREMLNATGLDALIAESPIDASPSQLIAHIERGIAAHRGGTPREDDQTLLVIRRAPLRTHEECERREQFKSVRACRRRWAPVA